MMCPLFRKIAIFVWLYTFLVCVQTVNAQRPSATRELRIRDLNAIRSVKGDVPREYVLQPEDHRDYSRGYIEKSLVRDDWNVLKEPVDGQVGFLTSATVERGFIEILLGKDADAAYRHLEFQRNSIAGQLIAGSYSGKKLGHTILRPKGETDRVAGLHVVYHNVYIRIVFFGARNISRNWPQVVENVAQSVIERIDATVEFEAATPVSLRFFGHDLPARQVNGRTLVSVKDYAEAAGIEVITRLPEGKLLLRRGSHRLTLWVGRREAEWNGEPEQLAFPALRYGPDAFYCPVDILNRFDK
jgi:hypothetical protein